MSIIKLETKSYKLRDKLYINEHTLIKEKSTKPKPSPTTHIFCCDVSYSMYKSLPLMREQLKSRLPKIIQEGDLVSIIAFSSASECYVLTEKVNIGIVSDLKKLESFIDTYLQPKSMTNFVKPINLTEALIQGSKEDINWIFLSDGGHNESDFSEVMSALSTIKDSISNATIIEYGYFADSKRLTEMAEYLGGTKITAEDFNSYVPIFEGTITGGCSSRKQEIDVTEISESLRYPQFIYINSKSKRIYSTLAESGSLKVPTSVKTMITLSKKIIGTKVSDPNELNYSTFSAAAYVFADKLEYNVVESILSALGDIKLIDRYSNSFGKQRLFEFQNEVLNATFYAVTRGPIKRGYKAIDSKYCIIDVFNVLCSDEANLINVLNPEFKYTRIGAKQKDKIVLNDLAKSALANVNTLAKADRILDDIKKSQLSMAMIDKGYPISNFTWNEERANLSALMKIDVELYLPNNSFGIEQVNSFVFRNYTIVKDGILNINRLPISVSQKTFELLRDMDLNLNGFIKEDDLYHGTLDISNVPILNNRRVRASKMKKMTNLALNLMDLKFQLKYLGYLKKMLGTPGGYVAPVLKGYTQAESDYLYSLGITTEGYKPEREEVKSGDFYMALTLNSNFKGFSSIPSIESLDKKLKSGKKLTAAEDYLQRTMQYVDRKYLKGLTGDRYRSQVGIAFNLLSKKKVEVSRKLSQMKFAMIVSRKWFTDCESFDDNTDTIISDLGPELTIEYRFTDKKQNL